MAPGYRIKLFSSEKEFPDLANPVQLSFDNKGRLWVATLPNYPHYKPGNAKLLILKDTDGDGKADKQTVFADGLHLPIDFELAAEGVYLSGAIYMGEGVIPAHQRGDLLRAGAGHQRGLLPV